MSAGARTHPQAPLTLVDVLREHGVQARESELAEALDRSLGTMLSTIGSTGLSEREQAVFTSGGLHLETSGAYAHAAADSVATMASLVATAVPLEQAATRLGVSRARLQQRLSAGDLWAIRGARGRWVIPAIAFRDHDLVPGLGVAVASMPPGTHPLSVLGFLTTAAPELELRGSAVTPRDWLAAGGALADVLALVETLALPA